MECMLRLNVNSDSPITCLYVDKYPQSNEIYARICVNNTVQIDIRRFHISHSKFLKDRETNKILQSSLRNLLYYKTSKRDVSHSPVLSNDLSLGKSIFPRRCFHEQFFLIAELKILRVSSLVHHTCLPDNSLLSHSVPYHQPSSSATFVGH